MDRTTIHVNVLRLIEIRKKLKNAMRLSEEEEKMFLVGTGKSMPSDPSEAVIMIDEVFLQLKKVLKTK